MIEKGSPVHPVGENAERVLEDKAADRHRGDRKRRVSFSVPRPHGIDREQSAHAGVNRAEDKRRGQHRGRHAQDGERRRARRLVELRRRLACHQHGHERQQKHG